MVQLYMQEENMRTNGMTVESYQQEAYTAVQIHDNEREEILHWTIGLTEEAGEVASLIKHRYFHKEEISNHKIAEELGDVLWYVAAMCTVLQIPLEDVAMLNVAKLQERFPDKQYTDTRVQHRHDNDEVVEAIAKTLLG